MEEKCSSFLLKTSSVFSSFGQFAMSFDSFCFHFMQSHTTDLSLLNILLGGWSFFLFNKKTKSPENKFQREIIFLQPKPFLYQRIIGKLFHFKVENQRQHLNSFWLSFSLFYYIYFNYLHIKQMKIKIYETHLSLGCA